MTKNSLICYTNPSNLVYIYLVGIMKLSTKARYGLNACIYLAEHYDDGFVSVSELSKSTGTTEGYLEQIMALLKKADVVLTQRGAAGGYRLSAEPDCISVGKVLRAVEDDLKIIDCLSEECGSECRCKSRPVWVKLYENINRYLDTMNLKELITEPSEGEGEKTK